MNPTPIDISFVAPAKAGQPIVIPAKAGIQGRTLCPGPRLTPGRRLDSGLRRNDGEGIKP